MNIISKKSMVMSLALAGLIMGSMPMTVRAALSTPKKAVAAFVVASLLVTSCKEAVANPDGVDVAKDAKRLVQIQDLLTSDYWANVYHLFVDGWLGQIGKNEAILAIPNEDGTVTHIATKPKPSSGICGTTLFWVKAISKKSEDVIKFLAVPGALYKLFNGDIEKFLKNPFGKTAEAKNNTAATDSAVEVEKLEVLNRIATQFENMAARFEKQGGGNQDQAV